MKDITHLTPLLQRGNISRRRFISTAIAMGLTLPAAGLLARQALAATPKRGGLFRIGINHGSTTDSLDPATFEDTYMQTVGLALRNCLTEVDNNDELVGELAESWEASPDAKIWHFHLRKGIEFHNGKTLTSGDVVASLLHHLTEDSTSRAKGFLKPITSVKKDGTNTVRIELAEGNVDLPFLMSDYHVPVLPAKDGEVDWRSGVGTGGYVLKRYDPGVRTDLTRNPNYWKSGSAHFDEIQALVMPDVVARTSALKSDGIDAMNQVDGKTVSRLAQDDNINIHETQGTLHFGYAMRCDVAPFDNVDVRLALKFAIDREEFLQKILQGHGYVGNDHPIGKSQVYFNDEMPQRAYDPEQAKFHLKKAGLSKLQVELSVADVGFAAVDGAVLYSESARQAGIDIKVKRVSRDGYWSDVWGQDAWAAEYWAGRATEDWMFSTGYIAESGGWFRTKWETPRFKSLLKQARVELNEDKRRAMYYEMQQLCSDEDGALIPVFGNYVFATRSTVGQNRLSAAWDLDGIKCMERWWFV